MEGFAVTARRLPTLRWPVGSASGLTPLWQIRDLVDDGSVEAILQDFAKMPIHAVWSSSELLQVKTRLFVDLLAARLKRERL